MLIAGGAALAVTAAVGSAVVSTDSTDPVGPSVAQRPAYLIVQDEIDAALAARNAEADLNVQRLAYLIVQVEIAKALAERRGVVEVQRPAYLIVHDEIEAALAERSAGWSDVVGG